MKKSRKAPRPLPSREDLLAFIGTHKGKAGVREIARAFLADEATIAQRLVRAKRQIRDKGLSLDLPSGFDLRKRLDIPENYKVLFLQGGAIGENAIVPMNLLGEHSSADYVNTGEWSKKSIKEAKKYCNVNIAASSEVNPVAWPQPRYDSGDRTFRHSAATSTWR